MTTRRILFAAAAMTAAAQSAAQAQSSGTAASAPAHGMADFLFVQTARRMSYDNGSHRMTLHDVSPITLAFSDRPERIAANLRTADFVPFWSMGSDSFLRDPPNADVSILEGNELRQVVVVLRDPVLQDNALSYAVQVVEGEMPASGTDVSVFIDIIGMPLTPFSFAGRRRRVYRRAFMYR